uniref:Uncharacterized protein n=1 Tax=Anopheles minimus TaxID=112268 RepID=A0A182WP17_9DIPT
MFENVSIIAPSASSTVVWQHSSSGLFIRI